LVEDRERGSMAAQAQCDNCGSALAEADIFCGECGAPRPVPVQGEPIPDLPPAPAPVLPASQSSATSESRWRVATMVLIVLGILTCLAGLLAFLLAGFMEYEAMTVAENWLFSALCCLLPIGGAGAILIAVGAGLWYSRLRRR
jgi:hypothetical protein